VVGAEVQAAFDSAAPIIALYLTMLHYKALKTVVLLSFVATVRFRTISTSSVAAINSGVYGLDHHSLLYFLLLTLV